MSTTINGTDNSAATPALVGSDTDTGVFFPAADTMAFSTNGTEKVRVNSTGDVGIGTTNPTVPLDIFNETTAAVKVAGNSIAQLVVTRASTDATAAALQIQKSRGTIASPTIVASGDIVGRLQYFGYDGATMLGAAEIRATVDGTTGLDDMPTRLGFYTTADGASTVTEQARITSAGLFQFNSGYGSVATAYGCRAWVNFNGTGTVAIRASGNVTSITDNGTGDYTANFTTSMPNINYSTVTNGTRSGAGFIGGIVGGQGGSTGATASYRVRCCDSASTVEDFLEVDIAVFR